MSRRIPMPPITLPPPSRRAEAFAHDLLSARDSSWQGHEAHPADHGVDGEELLNLWLVAQEGIAIRFRCCDDKVIVEVVSPRHFQGTDKGYRLAAPFRPRVPVGDYPEEDGPGRRVR